LNLFQHGQIWNAGKGLRKPMLTVKQNLEHGRAFPFTQEEDGQDKYD